MYKLTFEKRVWIVKQYLKKIQTSKIALAQRISERTVQKLVKIFEEYGWEGLQDHKTGRPETILNAKVERWFRTYKTEFVSKSFSSIKDYIQHYNNKRLHMSLNYRTPK